MKNAVNKRWLVYRLGHMGDVVLTTGVLAYYGQKQGMTFDVVTKKEWAPLFDRHPNIGEIHVVSQADLALRDLLSLFRTLAKKYSGWGLLDLHGTLRSSMLRVMWQGPTAVYPKFSLERRLFLATKSKAVSRALCAYTVPQRYALALEASPPVAQDLLPRVWLSHQERQWAKEKLQELGVQGAKCVVLHPYASHIGKCWPVDYWQALAAMCDAAGIPWLCLGRGERVFPERAEDLTGKTGLRETLAILEACSLLVTGDSGPMHLASSVGTPVLALFGATTKEWGFYPVGSKDQVLELELPCRPCSLHGKMSCSRKGACLRNISPQDVFTHILASV